ncbi:MAG: phage holin family protein [Clostridiales bacterium]|jgi:toxin secretion/phage lysis holin|nr:phage holin family protein [Clostridiales bacterium]
MTKTEMLPLWSAAFGGFVGSFIGGWDGFIKALVMFCALDLLTGSLAALKSKKYSCSAAFWGLTRKCLIFAIVAVGVEVDAAFIGDGSIVRTAVIFFYASVEGVSVIENAGKLGVPIPKKLTNMLRSLDDKEEGKNE